MAKIIITIPDAKLSSVVADLSQVVERGPAEDEPSYVQRVVTEYVRTLRKVGRRQALAANLVLSSEDIA